MNSNKAVKSTKPLFYLIAILIPIVVLVGLESLLRVLNYGEKQAAFIPVPQLSGYLQPNPRLIERYFSVPELAPKVSPDTVYFKAQKAKDTFRIVIQGGSSAAGFPFGRFGSLQGMLQQRFKLAYPDKNIEIINTAMAAVNTFTLVDIQDEILQLEPDLVLVYAGHNEYLGVLGAGSVMGAQSSYGTTLMYLKLKSLRLFKFLEASYQHFKVDAVPSDQANRTVMASAAKGQNIPMDSAVYQQGIHQFSGNLDLLLSKYKQEGVPVYIGNLVSIEKDLIPFSGMNQAYQHALGLFEAKEYEQAKQSFILAKDLDELRFRAPSEFNDIIKAKAKEYDATLVDVETKFREAAPQGILDHSLLLEHVHPTKLGYFLLADAFFESLVTSEIPWVANLETNNAKEWSPISELNERYAVLKMQNLMNGFPFTDTPKILPKIAVETAFDQLLLRRLKGENWLLLQQDLLKFYLQANNLKQAALVAGIIADALVASAESHNTAANLFRKANQLNLALYHQRQSLRLDPDSEKYQMNLAFDLFLANRFDESLLLLHNVKQNTQDLPRVTFFIDKVSTAKEAFSKFKELPER
ncbi:SGNH/GDSL hydrolase family protein [Psychrosphaera aestuarii]|uniref:SGNH/GDSL hydrolase family protein n=1 Tax=Psychrosphaera aestuarii TaxID=1266052 RepID=UPI001B33598D|nr:hypothetical protein [Psychrosphaera aestuarii]